MDKKPNIDTKNLLVKKSLETLEIRLYGVLPYDHLVYHTKSRSYKEYFPGGISMCLSPYGK